MTDPSCTRGNPPADFSAVRDCRIRVRLFEEFTLNVNDQPITLPHHAQRLISFLALGRCTSRAAVSGALWPETTDDRARGALRTALWRLHNAVPDLLTVSLESLQVNPEVGVDVNEFLAASYRVLDARDRNDGSVLSVPVTWGDLLPGWDDDWVTFERDRLRQLKLHMLEARSAEFLRIGKVSEALDAGLAAVSAAPLRESSHQAVLRALIAAQDVPAARRHVRFYEMDRNSRYLIDAGSALRTG